MKNFPDVISITIKMSAMILTSYHIESFSLLFNESSAIKCSLIDRKTFTLDVRDASREQNKVFASRKIQKVA